MALPPEPGQAGKAIGVGEFVVIQHQCLQCWEPQGVPLACQRCYRCLPVSEKILVNEQGQGTNSAIPRKKWRIRNQSRGLTNLGTSLVAQRGPSEKDQNMSLPPPTSLIHSLLYGERFLPFTDRLCETRLWQDWGKGALVVLMENTRVTEA